MVVSGKHGLGWDVKNITHFVTDHVAQMSNEHWLDYQGHCHPCQMNYDYVVKMETLKSDNAVLNKLLGGDTNVRYPEARVNKNISDASGTSSTYKYDEILRDLELQHPDYSMYSMYSTRQKNSADMKLFGYTVKPVFNTTWEIGTPWELRTAISVPSRMQCVQMDLRNKTTSEFRTVSLSPFGVPNSQVPLYVGHCGGRDSDCCWRHSAPSAADVTRFKLLLTLYTVLYCQRFSYVTRGFIWFYRLTVVTWYARILDWRLMDGWMNHAYSRLSTTHGHITDCKLLVCMYWTRLVLVRPAASLYSTSPMKHHPTGKQWCPNPDHYSDSEPASNSFVLSVKQSSRTSNCNFFCLTRPGIEPPSCRMPGERSTTTLYPAAVMLQWKR